MTTKQALNNLFSTTAWWKNTGINESTARSYKKRFLEGKLEFETQMKILNTCGFCVVQQVQWERNMKKERLHMTLVDKLHQEHAFWSYDKSGIGDISDEVLIEKVLLYLDIDDIISLFQLFPKRMIQQVWKEKMLSQEPTYHGLNRLYAFMFFDIKNPDRYIRDSVNKKHKSLLCVD